MTDDGPDWQQRTFPVLTQATEDQGLDYATFDDDLAAAAEGGATITGTANYKIVILAAYFTVDRSGYNKLRIIAAGADQYVAYFDQEHKIEFPAGAGIVGADGSDINLYITNTMGEEVNYRISAVYYLEKVTD